MVPAINKIARFEFKQVKKNFVHHFRTDEEDLSCDLRTSTSDLRPQTFDLRPSTSDL